MVAASQAGESRSKRGRTTAGSSMLWLAPLLAIVLMIVFVLINRGKTPAYNDTNAQVFGAWPLSEAEIVKLHPYVEPIVAPSSYQDPPVTQKAFVTAGRIQAPLEYEVSGPYEVTVYYLGGRSDCLEAHYYMKETADAIALAVVSGATKKEAQCAASGKFFKHTFTTKQPVGSRVVRALAVTELNAVNATD